MAESRAKKKGKEMPRGIRPIIDPDLVSALSHPLRLHVLDVLSESVASPSDLAREAGLGVNYVAYHVKELEKLGYVELVKTEPRRGTVEHYYRASQRFLIDDREWELLPKPIKKGLVAGLFQIVIDDVREALEAGTFDERNGHISNARLQVDEQGWEELTEMLDDVLKRVLALQAECAERLAEGDEPGIPVAVALAGFETPPRPRPDTATG